MPGAQEDNPPSILASSANSVDVDGTPYVLISLSIRENKALVLEYIHHYYIILKKMTFSKIWQGEKKKKRENELARTQSRHLKGAANHTTTSCSWLICL